MAALRIGFPGRGFWRRRLAGRACAAALGLASLFPAVAARAESPSSVGVEAAYTGEMMSLLDGGLKRGTRYLDNLDLKLAFDLERFAGVSGTRLFLYGLYNNGARFSEDLAGDGLIVSNIETGVQAARLYEAWLEHGGAWGSLKVGLYDLNSEFDSLDAAGLFIGSAHGIGTDLAQTAENGPSIFPFTSLGGRLAAEIGDGLTIRAAILDGVAGDPARPKRTAIKWRKGDGALMIGETDWRFGSARLLAGYWRYTARYEDRLLSAIAGAPREARGNDGWYLRGEARVSGAAAEGARRLDVFARFGRASGRFNAFSSFYALGAVYSGLVSSRPNDRFGLAVAWAEASRNARAAAALQSAPIHPREVVIEATYRLELADWLALQPDLQYVIHPSSAPNLKDALAFGLRFEIAWSD